MASHTIYPAKAQVYAATDQRGGTSARAMTSPDTTMPLRRAAGSWLAAAICQTSAMPPMSTLKILAGLVQIAAKAFMAIMAPEIQAAAQASREWDQAKAETNNHVPRRTLA